MSIDDIKADLKALVAEKNCGPILIRLSWHDAGKWSSGKLSGGKYSLLFVVIICFVDSKKSI
jgi:catalase (peroxidase I)